MSVYIDSEYRCHTSNSDGTLREIEESFFDNKCDAFIEGFCFIPAGESLTMDDGTVVRGKAAWSWKPYSELAAAQAEYERNRDTIEQLQAAVVDAEEAQAAYEEGVQLA